MENLKIKTQYNKSIDKKLKGLKSGSKENFDIITIRQKQLIAEMVDREMVPMIRAMIEKATAGDVAAFECLLNRYMGKPMQEVAHTGNAQTIVFMPAELFEKHNALQLSAADVVDVSNS